jgi:hypothetical protein
MRRFVCGLCEAGVAVKNFAEGIKLVCAAVCEHGFFEFGSDRFEFVYLRDLGSGFCDEESCDVSDRDEWPQKITRRHSKERERRDFALYGDPQHAERCTECEVNDCDIEPIHLN